VKTVRGHGALIHRSRPSSEVHGSMPRLEHPREIVIVVGSGWPNISAGGEPGSVGPADKTLTMQRRTSQPRTHDQARVASE
jgi:hypothetical protein